MKIINLDREPILNPNARIVDSKGRIVAEGYYYAYPKYMGYPIDNGSDKKIPLVEGVATYLQGDWGLANMFECIDVKPNCHIEIIGQNNEG